MKAFSKLFSAALILLSGGCSTKPLTYDNEIVMLIDMTDPLRVRPEAETIISLVGLDMDKWTGTRVRIAYISDRDISDETVITLEKENSLLGNPKIRIAKVERFKQELHTILDALDTASTCGHSIIYRTVATQLNALSASVAPHRYALIFSNMFENSEEVNLYDSATFSALQTNPQNIQQKLETRIAFPDLSGIAIWVLYAPASYEENRAYMHLVHFWGHLFESKGAVTHFQAKLN